MANNLIDFIYSELHKRGWTQSELARRANISPTTISTIFAGRAGPGEKFLSGIASAFSIPEEKIYNLAGVIAPKHASPSKKMERLFELLDEENKAKALEFVEFLLYSKGK